MSKSQMQKIDDPGVTLAYNMIHAKEKYLYSVSNEGSRVYEKPVNVNKNRFEEGIYEWQQTEIEFALVSGEQKKQAIVDGVYYMPTPASNSSKTKYSPIVNSKPVGNVDGAVTISPCFELDDTEGTIIQRPSVVFRELQESYLRTTEGLGYFSADGKDDTYYNDKVNGGVEDLGGANLKTLQIMDTFKVGDVRKSAHDGPKEGGNVKIINPDNGEEITMPKPKSN